MQATYEQFTSKAAKGRKMDVKKLEDLAGGRVFTGRQAVANGLADQLGTLDDAIAEAKTHGRPEKPTKKSSSGSCPSPRACSSNCLGGSSMEAEARVLVPELIEAFQSAESLRKLFAEPSVTVMPYSVKFK